jgi:hypothetical protein
MGGRALTTVVGCSLLGCDLVTEMVGRPPHRLFEQGQQELVLAAEVLVEAAERLAGALDDLLHGEILARTGVQQLNGRVEETLHATFGADASRVQ